MRIAAVGVLLVLLVWAPLAGGAYRGWPLAISQILVLTALVLWVFAMLDRGRLVWLRSALDLPLVLLIGVVLVQLAVGNGPLRRWALTPAADPSAAPPLPARFLDVGTVAPEQTARSLLLFLTYAAVYVLVVNLVRSRRELDRLVRLLLTVGGVLAFLGLLDYLGGETWLIRWREAGPDHRLAATFVNPDHFAAWLEMLICLGLGYLLARTASGRSDVPLGHLLRSREGRERVLRRYLPVVGVAVMALSLAFTLSRGGLVSLLGALIVLLTMMGVLGRARWSLVLVGGLLIVTTTYAAWIGLGPLLERVRDHPSYNLRLVQSESTLPMLGAFPLLGVGLGAYRDIYFRYQPPALGPGTYYAPFAHNDLLQVAVELGAIGTLICLFAVWRVGGDLVGAHVLGRARCPVGAGTREGARRKEPWSVGITLGALAGVLALLVHSAFDFSARIPADGILGATCLGIATVALHTRFSPGGDRQLAGRRELVLGSGWLWPTVARSVVLAVSLFLVVLIVRWPWVESTLEAARGPATVPRLDQAVAWAPRNVQALATRAPIRFSMAREIWSSGRTPDGRVLGSWEERRHAALPLLEGAVQDLRAALALTPTDPHLHETLGWVYGTMELIAPTAPASRWPSALAALRRAIVLQPENPFFYRSLATLALARPEPMLEVALPAGRAAAARAPDLIPDLVRRFAPAGPSDAQWAELVPPSVADRLELASALEQGGLREAAASMYRLAIDVSAPDTEPLARWRYARSLMRWEQPARAGAELDRALARDPDNPELHLARAQALGRLGDPAALDAYRSAVLKAQSRVSGSSVDPLPFRVSDPRVRAIAVAALDHDGPSGVGKYRRAYAQYLLERRLWLPAFEEWQRVLDESPDAAANFGSASALYGLGEKTRALEAYRKAVSLDGRVVAFRMGLARALWETDQYFQAINEWRAVIGEHPGEITARLALADALARIGQRADALREYQQILSMVPDQPEARRGLQRLGALSGG